MSPQIHTCGDCGCREGQLHKFFPNCDHEICPFCGGQLLSCFCKYVQLGIMDRAKYTLETSYLPLDVYTKGLSVIDAARWELMLTNKGRIPYIRYPVRCVRCGNEERKFFAVRGADWMRYIQPDMRKEVICKDCYRQIMRLIDGDALVRGEQIPLMPDPDNPLRELGAKDEDWSSDDAYGWHQVEIDMRKNAEITAGIMNEYMVAHFNSLKGN